MSFELVLAYDRHGAELAPFAFGFECGTLWEHAKHEPGEFSQTVHVENTEMVLRISEALGRPVSSVPAHGDGFVRVTVGATP